MKLPFLRLGLTVAVLTLAACHSQSDSPASPAPSATADAPANPNATVTPHPSDTPASAATGPAQGGTAIGGMVGNQDKGGANTGTSAAPTAGDGKAAPPK